MNDATIFKVLRFIVVVLNVKSLFVFRKRETVSSIDILQTEKKQSGLVRDRKKNSGNKGEENNTDDESVLKTKPVFLEVWSVCNNIGRYWCEIWKIKTTNAEESKTGCSIDKSTITKKRTWMTINIFVKGHTL